mgnify:CR=1 FL=1
MAKRIQPKLSHPRQLLVSRALRAAATGETKSLLRNLYLADRADVSTVIERTREECLADARDAAGTMVDYLVLHGTLDSNTVKTHIDGAIRRMSDESWCASYRDAAVAMVTELLQPTRRA